MNTPATPKQKLRIVANHIGPIMQLSGALSEEKQNLIFATNGTGKSFISRAFMMLDRYAENPDEINCSDIVSEESSVGSFSVLEDTDVLGKLELDTKGKAKLVLSPDCIFHVFSSDYVEAELKRKSYHELDGTITHEVIIGKPNLELDAKEQTLKEAREAYRQQREELSRLFEIAKNKIKTNFSITASLSDFKNLNLENTLQTISPEKEVGTLVQLKERYEKIKSLADGVEISDQPSPDGTFFDPTEAQSALVHTVTASMIEEKVRQRIIGDPEFFKTGVAKFEHNPTTCYFCTQELNHVALATIKAYQLYFADEEALLQNRIGELTKTLVPVRQKVSATAKANHKPHQEYEKFKTYFPDLSQDALADTVEKFEQLDKEYEEIQVRLKEKSADLTKVISVDYGPRIKELETNIRSTILANNRKISALRTKLQKADEERRKFQREACAALQEEFRTQNASLILDLETQKASGLKFKAEVDALKQVSGERIKARDKVASTFEYLLGYVFGSKYTFDPVRFVVQRNKIDMSRGGDRTLSDGEKAILGFCYYLAQTHLKVKRSEDYSKLFFVIDDPVSSVSFDYIYAITQLTKSIRVTSDDLLFDDSSNPKPRLLLLTHNDYFYNLTSTNAIIQKAALFQLFDKKGSHSLNSQKQFVAPHVAHMKEVVDIASGARQPSHQTANSIRCVLEGMWRFCKPDLPDLKAFVSFLANDLKLEIKSMLLLHNLSHGAKMYSESTFESDVIVAAKEIVVVVERLAPGQVRQAASQV